MRDSASVFGEAIPEALTRREREILALLAEGLTSPEIAERLTLALSTVKWHVDHIYGKLGASRKREAVARARVLGLLSANGSAPASAAPAPNAPRHNLPVQVTRFFGREDEIRRIRQRLAEGRLVTLSGPGGVGKTRLALRTAEAILDDYPEGVWFVELAALVDPGLVAQQLASTLALRDDPGRTALELLIHHLRGRHTLLVLDNCEHLLESCAQLSDALLRACPGLRLLACSREPLGAGGEAIYPVPSLPVPDLEAPATPQTLSNFASINLFADRARLVRPDYAVTPNNAGSIAGICQRVDGIPLAIEMAAARVNLLSAEQIVGRLDDAFRLLTAGSRTALPRQQTLRATIDWSYELLNAGERRLLQRLCVFAGGCTLEAAEAVCAGLGVPASQILDLLASLVAKSMVVAERPVGEASRYYLLEMVRQYAREKLDEAGDASEWHRRHRDYFLAYAEAHVPKLNTVEHDDWRPVLAKELDNFRQALEWSMGDTANPDLLVRLLKGLSIEMGFRHQEALDWYTRCLAQFRDRRDIPAALLAKVLGCAAGLTALNDPPAAVNIAAQAVEVSRAMGPQGRQTLIAHLQGLAGLSMADVGDFDSAVVLLEEAEALWQALAREADGVGYESEAQASFAPLRAILANGQRRFADGKAHATDLIQQGATSGNLFCTASGHTLGGIACLGLGEHQAAREHFQVALDLNRRMRGWEIAYNLRWLAAVDLAEGDLERAVEYCRESLAEANLIPDRNIIASNLGLLAAIYAKLGRAYESARLAGAAAALYARQKRKPWEDSSLDTLVPGWRERADSAKISAAFALGQGLGSDEALAYALEPKTLSSEPAG